MKGLMRNLIQSVQTTCLSILVSTSALAATNKPVIVAWEDFPRSYDPRYVLDANSQYLENLLHCALFEADASGATVPFLAEKSKWVDATTFEIQLRRDIQFSDGTPVTAGDVKATYDFFLQKSEIPSPRAGAFAGVKEVIANDHTVTFKLTVPDATLETNLVVGILKAAVAKGKMIQSTDSVAGCGPYTVAKTSVNSIELAPNPTRNAQSKAALSPVIFKLVKEENTRFAKLLSGEVDLVQNAINIEKLSTLGEKYKSLRLIQRPGINTVYIGFNAQDAVLKNADVRRAIAMAIDRDAILHFIMHDFAIKAVGLLPPDNQFFNKNLKPVMFDLQAASALLDKAGFPLAPGKTERFTLSYKTSQDQNRIAIAKTVAGNLSKIGIKVNVETLEWGRFKSDVEQGHVQMWGLTWIGFKDPDIFRYAFATDSFPPGGSNRGRFSNSEMDQLLRTAREETDSAKRRLAYDRVQKIVEEQQPYVFLFHQTNFAVVNKDLKGFEVYADGRYSALAKTTK